MNKMVSTQASYFLVVTLLVKMSLQSIPKKRLQGCHFHVSKSVLCLNLFLSFLCLLLLNLTTVSALMNAGEDCWYECGRKEGPCSWCGTEGLCCRKGWTGNGCSGNIGGDDMPRCVKEEVAGKFNLLSQKILFLWKFWFPEIRLS